jgi:putative oxidoreductase
MTVLERVSHAALGWVFIQAGAGVLRKPEVPTKKAQPVLAAVRSAVPAELPDDVVLVRLNAAVQVLAGAALTFGVAPRLASAVLIGSLVPTTAGGHRFWEFQQGPERNTQRNHLLKNISIVGGLVHVLITPRRRSDGEDRG